MSTILTPFERISWQARPYPSYLLPEGGSALCFFGAGFRGWNDVIHMARAKMNIDCVDVDSDKLAEMCLVYNPDLFHAHVDDAWEFAHRHMGERHWDVVSVDPFFGDAAERAWETLYLWTGLASTLVTLTVKSDTKLNVPNGWTSSFFPRTDNAAWMVLERA